MEKSKLRKILNVVKIVITWVMVALAVFMMIFTIISVATLNKTERSLFGYKMFVVLSDSMSATDFKAGDIIASKSVDPTTLQEGDIISFKSLNPDSMNEIITHKIRKKTTDANGDPGFITYGTTTNTDDETIVTYPYIIGKYSFKLSGLGHFFQYLKTTPGYIVCILIPFLVLIGMQGFSSVRVFRKYKREQNEAIEKERASIEAEREETKRLMQELVAMRSQMGMAPQQTPPQQQASTPPPSNSGEIRESDDEMIIIDETPLTSSIEIIYDNAENDPTAGYLAIDNETPKKLNASSGPSVIDIPVGEHIIKYMAEKVGENGERVAANKRSFKINAEADAKIVLRIECGADSKLVNAKIVKLKK